MKYLFSLLAMLILGTATAQPPAYCGQPSVITYADPMNCFSTCATLHAVVTGETPINAGIAIDDIYSGVIPIGFNFTYYGTVYNQCVIGANGMITFNNALAGAFNPWTISAALLGNASALNTICGPWFDMDITAGAGGAITYATSGIAPFRRFTATWCNVPLFDAARCPNLRGTTQIILYEGCNYIDVHVGSKPLCTAWNSGNAIIGVQNAAGTNAVVAPGRDFPTNYVCTNEAWRFTPSGATYTVASIPYAPVPLAGSVINWFQGTTLVGTGPTLQCVQIGQTYRAEVAGCNSKSTSTITPIVPGVGTIEVIDLCVGASGSYTLNLPGGGTWTLGDPTVATIDIAAGTVTGVGPGSTMFTYFSTWCSHTIQVNVKKCCSDTCAWIVDGNNINGGRNIFGTLTNDDIRILTNNTDRAVIKANGFTGIKQLGPTTTLDVDCIPPGAPSGLRLENLPFGQGNVLVVDPAGYVYVTQTVAHKDGNDQQNQIDALREELADLRLQLSIMQGLPAGDASHSLSVTPNPSDGRISVTYKISGSFKTAAIKVTDAQGRIIAGKALENNSGTVAISLPASVSGDVIVALLVDGKLVASQKEIIVK